MEWDDDAALGAFGVGIHSTMEGDVGHVYELSLLYYINITPSPARLTDFVTKFTTHDSGRDFTRKVLFSCHFSLEGIFRLPGWKKLAAIEL